MFCNPTIEILLKQGPRDVMLTHPVEITWVTGVFGVRRGKAEWFLGKTINIPGSKAFKILEITPRYINRVNYWQIKLKKVKK